MRLLRDLLDSYPAREILGCTDRVVSDIVVDSRLAKEETLFVARRGMQTDGVHFIHDAHQRGCRIVACDRPLDGLPPDCTFLLMDDLPRALGLWSHALWNFPSHQLSVFGVTGTNGKTTTSFLLAHLLTSLGVHCGIIGTIGAIFQDKHYPLHHTTPEAPDLAKYLALMRDDGALAIAMEVSSHALFWRRVEGMHFDGAIFTNLSQDHLDFHHTMSEYARTKKKLFDMLEVGKYAVVFADNPWSELIVAETQASVIRVGRGGKSDVRIVDEFISAHGSQWRLVWHDKRELNLAMPLVGKFNIENASLAITLLDAYGYDGIQLARALDNASPPLGRMNQYMLPNGVTVVIDYAHTPDALQRLLQECRTVMPSDARLLCIFGCGGDRDVEKRPIMGAIAARLADIVIVTSDNPRSEDPNVIAHHILAGIDTIAPHHRCAEVIEQLDRREAIHQALVMSRSGDWVVIAGKGHESYQLIGDQRIPFSDYSTLMEIAKTIKVAVSNS